MIAESVAGQQAQTYNEAKDQCWSCAVPRHHALRCCCPVPDVSAVIAKAANGRCISSAAAAAASMFAVRPTEQQDVLNNFPAAVTRKTLADLPFQLSGRGKLPMP